YCNVCSIFIYLFPIPLYRSSNLSIFMQLNDGRFFNICSNIFSMIDILIFSTNLRFRDRGNRFFGITEWCNNWPTVGIHKHLMDANFMLLPTIWKASMED